MNHEVVRRADEGLSGLGEPVLAGLAQCAVAVADIFEADPDEDSEGENEGERTLNRGKIQRKIYDRLIGEPATALEEIVRKKSIKFCAGNPVADSAYFGTPWIRAKRICSG